MRPEPLDWGLLLTTLVLCAIALILTSNAQAHPTLPLHLPLVKTLWPHVPWDKVKRSNAATNTIIYIHARAQGKAPVFHSGERPLPFLSDHHPPYPSALDFRFSGYEGLDAGGKLCQFLDDIAAFETMLKDYDLERFSAWGIYPDSLNPFFHFSVASRKRRWAYLDGEQATFEAGLQYAKDHSDFLCFR